MFSLSGQSKMSTADVLDALNQIEESPWGSIRRGEALDPRGLANRLGKYGIGSKALRVGDEVIKGYARSQFQDAWSRYLDADITLPAEDAAVTAVTEVTDLFNGAYSATDVTDVTDPPEPRPPRRPGCICVDQPQPCNFCQMLSTQERTHQ